MRTRTRLKTIAQQVLGRLPARVGDPIYHRLQRYGGDLSPHVDLSLRFVDDAEALLREHSGDGFAGRRVVELGSGWAPVVPFLLLARGAASVDTFDLNAHYAPDRIRTAAQAVLAAGLDTPDRLGDVARTGELPAAVRYHPRTPIERAGLAPASIDVALSRFVLEHVAPPDLVTIHRASLDWIAPTGSWVHNVSPSDHRSYDDATLSGIDFLRYDDAAWRRLAGNRYAYHNRQRRPDYREAFVAAGWDVVVDTASVPDDPEALAAAVPVDERFRGYSAADLTAGNLWFLLGLRR